MMKTIRISLPGELKAFVEEQVASGGYRTGGEYVRELIRRDQDRQQLRGLLLEGCASKAAGLADHNYFDGLRTRVRERPATKPEP